MQKKILKHMISIIPWEQPRLHLPFYQKMFEHLLGNKEYQCLCSTIKAFPSYLINTDSLIHKVKEELEKNQDLAENDLILSILYQLHDMQRDF